MADIAIRVDQLGKRYRLGAATGYRTFRETISRGFSAPARLLQNRLERKPEERSAETFWALKDVSFDVKRGEVLGVIGRNGAGKSTLLKILSRITEPSTGCVRIWGRVGSLLEVGTGFHPELSGRENIFLNGAILGMRKKEILHKMEEIIAFAEIERFLDTAVKHYSSGMYLRLAFAVAAHLEPEILLMDEVLAVGDASFQKKCLGKMGTVASEGRTVLFVSHNMSAIRELCGTAIWIDKGTIRASGDVEDVIRLYLQSLSSGGFEYVNPDAGLAIENVALRNADGEACTTFRPGEDMIVEIAFNASRRVDRPYAMLVVEGVVGKCFTANMLWDGHRPESLYGRGSLRCHFKALPLLPQNYTLKMAIRASDGRHHIVPMQEIAAFDVVGRLEDYGLKGEFYTAAARSTSVVVPYDWHLPDGSVGSVELKLPANACAAGGNAQMVVQHTAF